MPYNVQVTLHRLQTRRAAMFYKFASNPPYPLDDRVVAYADIRDLQATITDMYDAWLSGMFDRHVPCACGLVTNWAWDTWPSNQVHTTTFCGLGTI